MNIYEKLLAVQQELKAPKGQYNNFGKYKYRSCEDILEAVKPILGKNKSAIYISDSVQDHGDRHYIEAAVSFVDCETGESLTVKSSAREEDNKKGMDASQVSGAASSYARKYALNGLLCIDDTRDSDATNTHDKDSKSSTKNQKDVEQNDLPAAVCCTDCGTLVLPRSFKGKEYSVQDIVLNTVNSYGVPLCWDCSTRRKAAQG